MKKKVSKKKDPMQQPATKADVALLKTKFEILEEQGKALDKKIDQRIETLRHELITIIEEFRDQMIVLIENAVGDIVGATKDKFSLTDDKIRDHEHRIRMLGK